MSTERYDIGAHETVPEEHAESKLLYVSTSKFGDDWSSVMHAHAYAEIFYIVSGMGQFKIEDMTVSVSSDCMVVINPNVKHTEVGLNTVPFEYIVLGIEGPEFSMRSKSDNRYCVVDFRDEREILRNCLKNLVHEIENKPLMYTSVCREFLKILLAYLSRRTVLTLTGGEPGEKTVKNCAAVRRYIDVHFKESITLEQLADVAHFNKYYMSHSFSRQYGISPINYLIARRIAESKHLLAETDHSLSQIAGVLGFSSPSYFSQSFRKSEGVSPAAYRKHILKSI